MKIKYFSWLPAAAIMGAIFWFSSKTADISQESSLSISLVILNVFEQLKSIPISEPERLELLAVIDHFVRKSAHFTEYACLSAAIAFHFTVWKKNISYRTFIPIIITGLYAATDEFHQTFVPGRSGQVSDVLLGTAGAAAGALAFYILNLLFTRRRQRKIKPTA